MADPLLHAPRFIAAAGPWMLLEYGRVMLAMARATDHTSFAYTAAPWPQFLTALLTVLAFLGFAALWFRFSFFRPRRAPARSLRQWWPCGRRYLWLSFVAFAAWMTFFYFLHPQIWIEVLKASWLATPSNGPLIISAAQAIYLLVFAILTARLSFLFVSAAVDEDWPRLAEVWASAKGQTLPIVAAFILYTVLLGVLKYLIIVRFDDLDLHFLAVVAGNPYRSFASWSADKMWWMAVEIFVGCLGFAWLIGFIGRRYRQAMDRQSMTRAVEAF